MSNTIRLNAELTGASISFDANLNAAGLEELIRMLAQTRAKMQPPVTEEQRDIAATGETSLLEDLSRLAFEYPDSTGTTILRVRSTGLGWLSWRLQRSQAIDMRDFLNGYFPDGGENSAVGREKPTH